MKALFDQVKYFFGDNTKDGISNLLALMLIIAEAVNQAMTMANDNPINWGRLSLVIAISVLGWLNGKATSLKSPPAPQEHEKDSDVPQV